MSGVNKKHSLQYGSEENAITNAGAGAYSNIFNIRYPVRKYCDNFDAVGKSWQTLFSKNNEIPNSLPQTMESFVFEWQLGTITFKIQQIGVKNSVCYSLGHHGDMDGDHLKNCPEVFC
ncbi:hypothetical protein NPIL_360161 [Nephila pilipes]|uniref:Uncharacterized protein n=1 Tax=Nephila pilipes TaxID=299642 RepID=A0A8X6QAK2_NEPPI|nr:hypothetical protein NPIL_360161 [Nephila pilipes]